MARLGTAVLLLACAATVSALPPLLGGPPPHLGNPACVAMAGRLQTGACHPVSETLRPQAGQLATATCATVKDMAATAQARVNGSGKGWGWLGVSKRARGGFKGQGRGPRPCPAPTPSCPAPATGRALTSATTPTVPAAHPRVLR